MGATKQVVATWGTLLLDLSLVAAVRKVRFLGRNLEVMLFSTILFTKCFLYDYNAGSVRQEEISRSAEGKDVANDV